MHCKKLFIFSILPLIKTYSSTLFLLPKLTSRRIHLKYTILSHLNHFFFFFEIRFYSRLSITFITSFLVCLRILICLAISNDLLARMMLICLLFRIVKNTYTRWMPILGRLNFFVSHYYWIFRKYVEHRSNTIPLVTRAFITVNYKSIVCS